MKIICVTVLTMLLLQCHSVSRNSHQASVMAEEPAVSIGLDTATFAAGCFWCVEAQLKELKGVEKVISGYTGGGVKNPTYAQVCTGNTGHAEAVNVLFNPKEITYDQLLKAFFYAHDPTQLNRQGDDVGSQYRSAIFYHNPFQQQRALYYIDQLNKAKDVYPDPVVTEVSPYTVFYKAEDYHQDFYAKNPNEGYCQYVIKPKMEKFNRIFSNSLKPQQ